MQLGFIGLGHLGKAITGRLIECGHSLKVWNRTPGKAEGLDATLAASPAEAATGAEAIHLCLFDSAGVHEVLTRADGLLQGEVRGKVIVDHSTNHFREVLELHRLCQEAGAIYLEAPVLGTVIPAAKGALTVLISGQREGYDRHLAVLEQVGAHLFYLEEPGLASKMKLINNLALGGFMAILGEAVAFAEAVGLERGKVLDILEVGGGQSLVLSGKKQKLLHKEFSTHFSNNLIYKDLHCLQDLAYQERRPLLTGAAIKEIFALALDQGLGGQDFSAVYQVFDKPKKQA